jgi:hypothetical protein
MNKFFKKVDKLLQGMFPSPKNHLPDLPAVGVGVVEVSVDVYPVMTTLVCQPCQHPMTFIGDVTATPPLLYQHQCLKCGRKHTAPKQYPHVNYVEIV